MRGNASTTTTWAMHERIVSKHYPLIAAMMRKKDPARSVRLMTEYAYTLVEKFNGIYLSEDKTTVLFYLSFISMVIKSRVLPVWAV